MSTISDRIKIVRTEATTRKMTRKEFAESLGVTSGVVVNWEDAENRLQNGIPEHVLRHICDVYHVNYVWLTTGQGDMMENRQFDSDALVEKHMTNESVLCKTIMKAFAKLPDEEWFRFRDLVDRIKKEGGI